MCAAQRSISRVKDPSVNRQPHGIKVVCRAAACMRHFFNACCNKVNGDKIGSKNIPATMQIIATGADSPRGLIVLNFLRLALAQENNWMLHRPTCIRGNMASYSTRWPAAALSCGLHPGICVCTTSVSKTDTSFSCLKEVRLSKSTEQDWIR
jgi:hypothetical protein